MNNKVITPIRTITAAGTTRVDPAPLEFGGDLQRTFKGMQIQDDAPVVPDRDQRGTLLDAVIPVYRRGSLGRHRRNGGVRV